MELVNRSPFAAERILYFDSEGLETLLVLVKGTFDVGRGAAAPSAQQVPVALVDEYAGEPDSSALLVASDFAVEKPLVDVLLAGCAYPTERGGRRGRVRLQLGTIDKAVDVFGDRQWRRFLGWSRATAPAPFERIPLMWERAFGGTDASREPGKRCEDNPVGLGFRRRWSKLPLRGTPLPNFVDLRRRRRRAPNGFGPLAPHWRPRARYAGTYDEAWQRDRCPLLPADFDPRFFQIAPPDQRLAKPIRGGEAVRVTGATREGLLEFTLPEIAVRVAVRIGGVTHTPDARCDTVVIDSESRTVTLTFRARLPVQGHVDDIAWIKTETPGAFGHD